MDLTKMTLSEIKELAKEKNAVTAALEGRLDTAAVAPLGAGAEGRAARCQCADTSWTGAHLLRRTVCAAFRTERQEQSGRNEGHGHQ